MSRRSLPDGVSTSFAQHSPCHGRALDRGEQPDGQDAVVPEMGAFGCVLPAAAGRPWPPSVSPATRQSKMLMSLRVDPDVLAWFRAQGPGY